MGDPDRRLEVRDVVEHEGREREGAGAEAVDPRDLAVEGERDELGLGGVARDLEREVVAGRAREHGAGSADLDERTGERGDEQPRALADGVGVGGEPGGDGRDGPQPGGRRGDRDGDGRARTPSA